MTLAGPGLSDAELQMRLDNLISPPQFPLQWSEMPAHKSVRHIVPGETLYWHNPPDDNAIAVRTMHSGAHPGGVIIYRIEWQGRSIVYASDVEGDASTDPRLIAFARDADVLIYDAQYTTNEYLGLASHRPATRGWGHSTFAMAVEVARAAHVRELLLFHHDPTHDDDTIALIQTQTRRAFDPVYAAAQGMTIELTPADMEPAGALVLIDQFAARPL
jgi:phosphoribosyl 1,2-cyclic phosphodiesterase